MMWANRKISGLIILYTYLSVTFFELFLILQEQTVNAHDQLLSQLLQEIILNDRDKALKYLLSTF